MGAKLACDLPCDQKQVKNTKYCSSTGHSSMQADVLAYIMQMCKDSLCSEDVFVRSVEAAPESMCVLATEQQLVDKEQFCTCELSSILSIDNLGPFYVTLTTYHNLFVTTPCDHCMTSNPGIPVCTAIVTPGMSAAAAAATPALPVCTAGVTPMRPLNILTGTPMQPFSTNTTTTGSGTPISIGPQVTYPAQNQSHQSMPGLP